MYLPHDPCLSALLSPGLTVVLRSFESIASDSASAPTPSSPGGSRQSVFCYAVIDTATAHKHTPSVPAAANSSAPSSRRSSIDLGMQTAEAVSELLAGLLDVPATNVLLLTGTRSSSSGCMALYRSVCLWVCVSCYDVRLQLADEAKKDCASGAYQLQASMWQCSHA